jgi:hypothetical protein
MYGNLYPSFLKGLGAGTADKTRENNNCGELLNVSET